MKLQKYESRGINLDTEDYNLQVNYPARQLNDKESIQFTSFCIYHCVDLKVRKLVANGNFTNKKVNNEPFSFIVEEITDREYNTSHIERVFFTSRNTIVGLIQGYFNGKLDLDVFNKPEVVVVEQDTNFVEVEFDDAFSEEDVTPISSREVVIPVFKEPVILIDKTTAKKNAPAKKGGRPAKKKAV